MIIGHINLAKSFNGTGEHFVALVEALDRHGINQHVIVRNHALAKRISLYDNVTLGPVTGSPVMAYCLMPNVDVVHVHNDRSAQSGLLLTLTRSIPFVLTRRTEHKQSSSPILRSIEDRAACLICGTGARQTSWGHENRTNRSMSSRILPARRESILKWSAIAQRQNTCESIGEWQTHGMFLP